MLFKMNMYCEMTEEWIHPKIGERSYKIRVHTGRHNNTLVIGSSLLKHITNDKFDTISISGARVETVHDYLKTLQVENYVKIGILAGGNNLRSWKGQEADSTLKVCLHLKLRRLKSILFIFIKFNQASFID